jgi:hypothetical protein
VPTSTSVEALATRRGYAPHVALGAAVAAAFVAYALLAHTAPAPRVFPDELIYLDAASSLGRGDGLEVREEPYRYAVLYPIVIAPLFAGFDREAAYELVKLLNALLFALAAVPVYPLARRVLAPWPSVAVAALSIGIPSAMYTSVVMTESLAYLVSCSALLAILRAVERPTVQRQGVALAAITVAYLVRPQFFALYVAYVLALIATPLLLRTRGSDLRKRLGELWPTIAAGVLVLGAVVLRPFLSGASPSESLGAYSVLWRAYSPFDVGRYVLYELANLELYLGIVPVVLAPFVITAFVHKAREGHREHAAFVAVFVSVNAVSSPWSLPRQLHVLHSTTGTVLVVPCGWSFRSPGSRRGLAGRGGDGDRHCARTPRGVRAAHGLEAFRGTGASMPSAPRSPPSWPMPSARSPERAWRWSCSRSPSSV